MSKEKVNIEKEWIENINFQARVTFNQLSEEEVQNYANMGRLMETYAMETQGAPPLPDQSDTGYAYLALLAETAKEWATF